MKNANDVGQVVFLDPGVVQSASAGVATWLSVSWSVLLRGLVGRHDKEIMDADAGTALKGRTCEFDIEYK